MELYYLCSENEGADRPAGVVSGLQSAEVRCETKQSSDPSRF